MASFEQCPFSPIAFDNIFAPKFRRIPYISWKFEAPYSDYGQTTFILVRDQAASLARLGDRIARGHFTTSDPLRLLDQAFFGRKRIKSVMNSISTVLILIVVLALGAVGGLIFLGQSAQAPVQSVEKVLPDGQFPR